MVERQQVLQLWASGSSLDSGTVAWAFHDSTDGTGPVLPDGTPPYASAVDALRDGWMLLQISQLIPSHPGDEHRNSYLEHEFVLERRIETAEERSASP